MDNEASLFKLHVSGYSGDAGNGLAIPLKDGSDTNGLPFSTSDNNHDNSGYSSGPNTCIGTVGGAWWFNACCYSCTTCDTTSVGDNFYWHPLYDLGYSSAASLGSLIKARLMIQPNS